MLTNNLDQERPGKISLGFTVYLDKNHLHGQKYSEILTCYPLKIQNEYSQSNFSPALKKWGLYFLPHFEKVGAILDLGCLSFRHSVPPLRFGFPSMS